MDLHIGCVENRYDPLKLGRCQVRIVGLHTEDKTVLPTQDLPWAHPMMPISSASISGIGRSPTGVVQGSWVLCTFLDEDKQQPIMMGTIGGIPHTKTASYMNESTNRIITTDETGELIDGNGETITDIINDLLIASNPSTVQDTGSKYNVTASNSQTSTGSTVTYTVVNKNDNTTIASATYDETTGFFVTTLSKPEKYTQEQYLPFTQPTPKTFTSTKEMLNYFDTNF